MPSLARYGKRRYLCRSVILWSTDGRATLLVVLIVYAVLQRTALTKRYLPGCALVNSIDSVRTQTYRINDPTG
jgi:hypothetical protein